MIQLHRMEGFYWVARTGGYSKAARAFPYPITQPAVHQQVKKLEEELGLDLFERIGKDRMQLTAAGKSLFEFIRPFFEQLPGVIRSVKAGEYEGELNVLAQGLMLRHLMPAWLKRIQKRRAGLRVNLREMPGFDIAPLRGGEVDLIVGFMPDVPDDIASMRIATLYPFLVVPREHRLAQSRRLALKDLSGDTFISYNPGHLAHELQNRVLAEHHIVPGQVLSAGSADTILGFVEAGLGFSLVPSLDPKGPRGKGLVAKTLNVPARFPVLAMWRLDTPENPFLDAALETAP
ncbi:MAG: LysR family transcriptional regulator, partial [Planctomycetota bacterium]